MNTNEQKAQRDKLIELAKKWKDSCVEYELGFEGVLTRALFQMEEDEKAFRDYVEHMHDEPLNPISDNQRYVAENVRTDTGKIESPYGQLLDALGLGPNAD